MLSGGAAEVSTNWTVSAGAAAVLARG